MKAPCCMTMNSSACKPSALLASFRRLGGSSIGSSVKQKVQQWIPTLRLDLTSCNQFPKAPQEPERVDIHNQPRAAEYLSCFQGQQDFRRREQVTRGCRGPACSGIWCHCLGQERIDTIQELYVDPGPWVYCRMERQGRSHQLTLWIATASSGLQCWGPKMCCGWYAPMGIAARSNGPYCLPICLNTGRVAAVSRKIEAELLVENGEAPPEAFSPVCASVAPMLK